MRAAPSAGKPRSKLRVPDQNLWTGELLRDRLSFLLDPAGRIRLSYQDPRAEDWEHGVLWVRHGQDRTGHPKWRAVNTGRTRRMMRDHLCMVCSQPCRDPHTGRISWLLIGDPEISPVGPITNVPPTCRSCIPEALETCPKLETHPLVITVAGTAPIGITADLFTPSGGTATKIRHEISIPFNGADQRVMRAALAKQLWVALLDMLPAP